MLLHRNLYIAVLTGLLLASTDAGAGLYGFDKTAPYSHEEKILRMDYLPDSIRNYREAMRDNLLMLIDYARKHNPDFQIISHEGQELLYKSRWEYELEGYNRVRAQKENANDPVFLFTKDLGNPEPQPNTPLQRYLYSVNAVVLNNYYCGAGQEEKITVNHGLGHISIEQCADEQELDRAVVRSLLDQRAIYPFVDRRRAFRDLVSQPLINDSARNIHNVQAAKNIAFLLDDRDFSSAENMVKAISDSNFDIVVINPLFHARQAFDAADVRRMQFKKNGGKRLLIAEMNVSEASPQDYFWKNRWHKGNPSWLVRESFVTPGAYITRYWAEEWQQIISRHFKDIVATGYDGVFFTGLQNHNYFEHLTPLE